MLCSILQYLNGLASTLYSMSIQKHIPNTMIALSFDAGPCASTVFCPNTILC